MPGTDLPAALIAWVVVVLSLEKIEEGAASRYDFNFLAVLVLSLFTLTIKLSVLPLMLLPLVFLLRMAGKVRRAAMIAALGLGAAVFIPWMGRSWIQSGYLVYPLASTAVFSPDWRIPRGEAVATVNSIRNWAKIATPEHEIVSQLPPQAWIPIWYQNQEPLDRQILLANGAALGLLAVLAVWRARRSGGWKDGLFPVGFVYLSVLLGIFYWFFQAPTMRFGYAFLGIFPVLCLAPFLIPILTRSSIARRWGSLGVALLLVLYQGVSIYRLASPETLRQLIFLPADYPAVETIPHTIRDRTLFNPLEGELCWYEPFPCAPLINPNLELRGADLQDGFRVRR